MKHIDKLLEKEHEIKADTEINLLVAKDYGYYAGILYAYLQRQQAEQETYSDRHNVRLGFRWIPTLPYSSILRGQPVFPDTLTIKRAADELVRANLILTETTGIFLEAKLQTGRARDISTWWCVSREYKPRTDAPPEYANEMKHWAFSALEAAAYGIPQALILAHWRRLVVVETEKQHAYKKLSAVELASLLPMDERTARRHLKALVKARLLGQHPTKPKWYRLV